MIRTFENASVYVESKLSVEEQAFDGQWFSLSDYSDLTELYSDAARYFDQEDAPELFIRGWDNIPEKLITEGTVCSSIFEIRNALDRIEEKDIEHFLSWCEYHGHNIVTDDPDVLVSHYLDMYGNRCDYGSELIETAEEEYCYEGFSSSLFNHGRGPLEIFDENYD